jgi:hypothetical protein
VDEKVPSEGLAPLRRTVSAWLLQSNLKSNRSAGQKRPGGLRVPWPKASAPKLHHPDMATSKSKTLELSARGFLGCRSVTEPAPSHRPWAPHRARPRRGMTNLTRGASSAL